MSVNENAALHQKRGSDLAVWLAIKSSKLTGPVVECSRSTPEESPAPSLAYRHDHSGGRAKLIGHDSFGVKDGSNNCHASVHGQTNCICG